MVKKKKKHLRQLCSFRKEGQEDSEIRKRPSDSFVG